jgi:hypothetical protein
MTNEKEINIIDKDFNGLLPISVSSISKEFYGITDVQYINNNISNKVQVFVYTKNQSSIEVLDLVSIQIRLGAKGFQIINSLEGGLIYNLIY